MFKPGSSLLYVLEITGTGKDGEKAWKQKDDGQDTICIFFRNLADVVNLSVENPVIQFYNENTSKIKSQY